MSIFATSRHLIVTAFVLAAGFSMPVWAQSGLDPLLEELKTADPARAVQIVREVEREWELSGSTSVDMLLRRGRSALEEEDWRQAVEHFTAVTDHAPEFAEGYHLRATAYYRSGKFGPALSDLGHALALNPNHWDVLYGLGVLFRELGEDLRAERAFREVLALNPHHENAADALDSMKKLGIGQTL